MARLILKLFLGLMVVSARVILIHGTYATEVQKWERQKQKLIRKYNWSSQKLDALDTARRKMINDRFPEDAFKAGLMKLEIATSLSNKPSWKKESSYEKARDELRALYPEPAEKQDYKELDQRKEARRNNLLPAEFERWLQDEKAKIREKRRQADIIWMENKRKAHEKETRGKRRRAETDDSDLVSKMQRLSSSPVATHGSIGRRSPDPMETG